MKTLNLIGAGRVGQTLARLWHDSHCYRVQDVLTRSQASAETAIRFIGSGRAVSELGQMRAADIWLLAVPDGQIAATAAALAHCDTAKAVPAMAFHCSGALASSELEPLKALGWQLASAHCLLSFATPTIAIAQFPGTPCALEGQASVLSELENSFTALDARCFVLAAQQKLLYHAGAVFATNFLPVLQATAQQLWQESGMPADLRAQLANSLLQNAVKNILSLGPAAALTGPAARGDLALVQRQGQAVKAWNSDAGDAYQALSTLAARLAQSGHVGP